MGKLQTVKSVVMAGAVAIAVSLIILLYMVLLIFVSGILLVLAVVTRAINLVGCGLGWRR